MFDLQSIEFTLNIFLLGGLIGIVEYMKKQDKKAEKKRNPRYYGRAFIIFTCLAAMAVSVIQGKTSNIVLWISQSIINSIVYIGIGAIGYQSILKIIKIMIQKLEIKDDLNGK